MQKWGEGTLRGRGECEKRPTPQITPKMISNPQLGQNMHTVEVLGQNFEFWGLQGSKYGIGIPTKYLDIHCMVGKFIN